MAAAIMTDDDDPAALRADLTAAWEEIGRLKASMTGLLDLHETVLDLLENAPELNPSNYDHEDVCHLNSSMIEAFLTMRDAFAGNVVAAARAALAGEEPCQMICLSAFGGVSLVPICPTKSCWCSRQL